VRQKKSIAHKHAQPNNAAGSSRSALMNQFSAANRHGLLSLATKLAFSLMTETLFSAFLLSSFVLETVAILQLD